MEENKTEKSDDWVVTTFDRQYINKEVPIQICETHKKDNWFNHVGYTDNKDGTVSCKLCPWGCRLPGYMRCYEEKIIDLRSVSRD